MEHIYQRRVSFADTDAAGVVHFSRLLCYAEEAEHDLLSSLAIPLLGGGGWPRVNVSCDYLAPARLGDTVEVSISPVELGKSSVLWRFSMKAHGVELARGDVKTVRVDSEGKPEVLSSDWREALS